MITTETLASIRLELAAKGLSNGTLEELMQLDNPPGPEDLRALHHELNGLGQLTTYLTDPTITDLVINPDATLWADRGHGMEELHTPPAGALLLDPCRIAEQLTNRAGVRLDHAQPFADGVLESLPESIPAKAIRFHASLHPPAVSLRMLGRGFTTLDELRASGTLMDESHKILLELVHQRANILISGGTGTGKTTLLTALLNATPHHERIIVAEDSPEILTEHPHVLTMRTRRANAEGAGELTLRDLVRQSLRMRPDRVIVGEVRGPEAADLLVALNTGHDGSAGTIHANSPTAVPGRMEALCSMAGLTAASITRQLHDGVDAIVHLERNGGTRVVSHIATLRGEGTTVHVENLWTR